MNKMTVNELLGLQRAARQRLSNLRHLQSRVSVTETLMFGTEEKKVFQPEYNVKEVDRKIVELERFLYESDAKVKASNAVTEVDIEVDVDRLLSSIV